MADEPGPADQLRRLERKIDWLANTAVFIVGGGCALTIYRVVHYAPDAGWRGWADGASVATFIAVAAGMEAAYRRLNSR